MRQRFGRKTKTTARTLSLLAVMCLVAAEQTIAQPQITVSGNITMSITTGVAGGLPTPAVNTTITLSYRRQNAISKITVGTSCPGQSFTLKVLATSVTDGTGAPEVNLVNGMPATDFITNIPVKVNPGAKTCTLQYTASATFAQGNSTEDGDDVHTVTYTILAQ